jgi:hypothetical protein
VPPVAAFGAPYINSLLLIIVAPLHVFARPVTCAFDIAEPANKAALWTVILAGMALADVFNLKHLHHSPVVNYRFTTQNRTLSLVISKNLQISPDFKDIRKIALLFKGFCFQQISDTVNHYSRSRYKKYVHHVPPLYQKQPILTFKVFEMSKRAIFTISST